MYPCRDKASLRRHFRLIRSRIPDAQMRRAPGRLIDHFLALQPAAHLASLAAPTPASHPAILAGYISMHHELDVLPLMRHMQLVLGWKIALPAYHPAHPFMEFRLWNGEVETLIPSGLWKYWLEPSSTAPVILPQVILVPLLACDHFGHRLGYGKGLYDRTLNHLAPHHIYSVGVGYHQQYLADSLLPRLEHDTPLDALITDDISIRFTRTHSTELPCNPC